MTVVAEQTKTEPAKAATVVLRPHLIRIIGFTLAPILAIAFGSAGIFMRVTYTGAHFRISDQVAMVIVGLLLAAGALVLTRPRLIITEDGVDVRGFIARKQLAWTEILGISFPDKAYFAKLDLPHDEHYPAIAIQSWDGPRAVKAIRILRARYAAARPE